MPRRVWIIAKKGKIEQSDIDDAKAHNCPEIANGIPPALRDKGIFEEMLPLAYEEPESPPPPEPIDLKALKAKVDDINKKVLGTETEPPLSAHVSVIDAIDTAKARPVRIKRVWKDKDYFHDCFATESVKDQYLAGDVAVGDYVIVHFDDIGEQIVTAKVFKSW